MAPVNDSECDPKEKQDHCSIIFHKNINSVDGSEIFCECSLHRKHKCPVIAATMELEDGEIDLLYLYHPDIQSGFHTWNQCDKAEI